jgi:hypothetical protein
MNANDVSVKDIVKDNHVRFLRYRQGVAYFVVGGPGTAGSPMVTREAWMFPVPLADVGDATLEREDKAIFFMRWIRKAIADGTFVPARE